MGAANGTSYGFISSQGKPRTPATKLGRKVICYDENIFLTDMIGGRKANYCNYYVVTKNFWKRIDFFFEREWEWGAVREGRRENKEQVWNCHNTGAPSHRVLRTNTHPLVSFPLIPARILHGINFRKRLSLSH